MATNITNTAFHAEPSTSPVRYAAQRLDGAQRQQLAVDVLAGSSSSVTELAERHQVSRTLSLSASGQRRAGAEPSIFAPSTHRAEGIVLSASDHGVAATSGARVGAAVPHSSFRGVVEFFRDVLDCPVALGSVHNSLMHAVVQARQLNAVEELSAVRAGGHDEIFQSGQPVLVGMDLDATYCYLLAAEDQRDSETWAIHLWDLTAKGLQPDYTVADGGKGLRADQALAWPELPCHGDVFHALQELGD